MTLQSTRNTIHQRTGGTHEDTNRSDFERNAESQFLNASTASGENERKTSRLNNNRIKLRQEKRAKLPEYIDPHQSAEIQQGFDEEFK